ncbi:pilus assembly protein TadC [Rhizorhabdus wittichii DC-6]|jgi:tight adherence protein C|uniref:Type II secretion system protein n=1 Tax=Rhizorhabdus wittichii (strain DSM 6014 / CCUG 31198 / JCM 15750 / NBRC 105917 / EY 4224 / RW1) TaxID=392499 RepID=A0A9J9HG35_RHIWR|nr:type II secretion system protein [Rhizorhabdus wittichii RW1]ARR51971.1 pilus assembly protein TadC [Rhizorhabdus wittichii DC-6]
MQPAPSPQFFDTLLSIGIALATAIVMLVVGHALVKSIARDPMARRVRALNDRREQLKAGVAASKTRRRQKMDKKASISVDRMKAILGSMKMLQDSQLKAASLSLTRAGIRTKDAAITVIFFRLVSPVLIGGTAVVGVYVLHWFPEASAFKQYMIVAGALIASYKAPDVYVKNLITKRQQAIRKALPDALDLLVICAEAGLSVDLAFNRVARELSKAYPELGDEFALTAIELGFLTDRRQAFENLAQRVNLDSIRGVVTTMIQTEKYGTPLAAALRVLSAEFRHERMMRAEEKAARLPAIMTVPLIMFILPVLFIVILGPAACSIRDNVIH